MLQCEPIHAFADNYIWLLQDGARPQVALVDPGDGTVCVDYMQQRGLQLTTILITHHHHDHVGGIEVCRQAFPDLQVYGPAYTQDPAVRGLYDHELKDGVCLELSAPNLQFTVMHTPGHTLDHICYYGHDWLLCGDTLFSGGCGRLFEGTAAQMYASLQRLSSLPVQTLLFCAHEYTLSNLQFAAQVEPANQDLISRLQQVRAWRAQDKITLPVSLQIELATNPFLRCQVSALQQAVALHAGVKDLADGGPVAVFAALRAWKDAV